MKEKDKQILALRTAYIAGLFSVIVCSVILLNYWQLVTTDPLESEALKALVDRFQEDATNEELKLEIRNLDLMVRSAFFTSKWQIRSGAFLLVMGLVIMVSALRIYYSIKLKVAEPVSNDASLLLELMVSRKWILYGASVVFGFTLISSYLSIDHLSETYAFASMEPPDDGIPVQEITPLESEGPSAAVVVADSIAGAVDSLTSEGPPDVEDGLSDQPSDTEATLAAAPTVSQINKYYPSFRGPLGLGVSHHKNVPTDWDGASGKNVKWKTKVPLHGYNSPILWGSSLFLTGADKTKQSVYCYNAATGKLKWEHKVTGIDRPGGSIKPTEDTGYAAPTAATDGRYVFAIFATGDLVCTDMNGKQIWAKNVGMPDNHYGHSSSLLVWKDLLLIQFDTNKGGKVLGLNVHSGEQAWETARSSKISWASPVLANLGDHYELVLASTPDVAAYDPATGKELWSVKCLHGEVGPSPAFHKGTVYAVNEYAKLVAIKPGKTPSVLWESNEYLSEVSSPAATGNLLIVPTSYGIVACYNNKSGELLWEYEADEGFYSSPIVAEGKIYLIDKSGKMHIFAASEKLELINGPELGETAVSSPAFSDGKIFIRGYDNLYCIGS